LTELNISINMHSLINLQMCNNYLLKVINFLNYSKNRETPIENKTSDLSFLQKKRKSEQPFLNNQWNYMTPKKDINFSILNQTDEKSETNGFLAEPIRLPNCKSSTELSFEKQKSQFNQLNEIENLIKKMINSNSEYQKLDLKDNNLDFYEKLFKDGKNDIVKNIEISKFKNVNRENNNLFRLINVNNNRNDLIENNCGKANDEGNNKRTKVKSIINNKLVYSNSKGIDLVHYSKNFQKPKKLFLINEKPRRSIFRGVSKNGNLWQVSIMINKNKPYIGTYPSEDLAAKIYDILAIKYKGNDAKTNFMYSESQIRKICNSDIDFKSKNLEKIISELLSDN